MNTERVIIQTNNLVNTNLDSASSVCPLLTNENTNYSILNAYTRGVTLKCLQNTLMQYYVISFIGDIYLNYLRD